MNLSQRPVISIIVPVFNSAGHLTNCIDSILAQTFTAFECILVDDGSMDKSLDICQNYSKLDSRIKVLHQDNAGVSAARNAGLKNCAGEYIAFVDSDDTVLPEMYQTMLDDQMRYNADIVCCGYLHKGKAYAIQEFFYVENQAKGAYNLEKGELFGLIWNKMYKKEILEEKNIHFLSRQSFGEDFLFNLKYFSVIHTVFNTPKILYIYNEGNVSSVSKTRPSFEQSYSRFHNTSKEILKLKDSGNYINFLLAMDFSYTVFLIRNLYIPALSPYPKRCEIISEIKSFYLKKKPKKKFRGIKYFFFYNYLRIAPFLFLDRTFVIIFSIIFRMRGYT